MRQDQRPGQALLQSQHVLLVLIPRGDSIHLRIRTANPRHGEDRGRQPVVEKCNRLPILGRHSDVPWHFEKRPYRSQLRKSGYRWCLNEN